MLGSGGVSEMVEDEEFKESVVNAHRKIMWK